ncbi:hypothetical protein FIBSPDRAFT_893323 [Athelia psychrophila]|uniref:Uncharacterized protein n=1 Tax=Athelia psychrophila TaxID=1759441 RepID=A0A166HDA0_9AGAM|nr:hypothetical protein FIBSPDRAFT_893323 [Fibularhizoctonia sp. CBS 109695]
MGSEVVKLPGVKRPKRLEGREGRSSVVGHVAFTCAWFTGYTGSCKGTGRLYAAVADSFVLLQAKVTGVCGATTVRTPPSVRPSRLPFRPWLRLPYTAELPVLPEPARPTPLPVPPTPLPAPPTLVPTLPTLRPTLIP